MSKVLRVSAEYTLGILLACLVAFLSLVIAHYIPGQIVGASVFALIIGIMINPLVAKQFSWFDKGLDISSKKLLKLAIVMMGLTLSFKQVLEVGGFSLIVMVFTLLTAFAGGYLLGKLFHMDWKLSSLISAGTGICGGSAIAAIAPVIKAKDSDIAYAIASTFIFDIMMVILFPIIGKAIGMSDLGYGLWTGTAVNDTSSVVAAGYAFSDIAGNYAIVVKLTRTLSIIPIAIIFSLIAVRQQRKELATRAVANESQDTEDIIADCMETVSDVSMEVNSKTNDDNGSKINWLRVFPFFIILFLVMVAMRSIDFIPIGVIDVVSRISKVAMVIAMASIGMRTNLKDMCKSGVKPLIHGCIISVLVAGVSFGVQYMLGQI